MDEQQMTTNDPAWSIRGYMFYELVVRVLIWGASCFAALYVTLAVGLQAGTGYELKTESEASEPRAQATRKAHVRERHADRRVLSDAFPGASAWDSDEHTPIEPAAWSQPDVSMGQAEISPAMLAWRWTLAIVCFVLVFNVAYVVVLILFRLPIPKVPEGYFHTGAGTVRDKRLAAAVMGSAVLRARVDAPFPGFLVYHVMQMPPFCWIVPYTLGPRSRSVLVLDPPLPDPDLVQIGRNVTIGNLTSVIAHTQYRDAVEFRKTIIEDDAMIGAHVLMYGGCHVKRGAVVYGGAVVPPNTVIGENEAWGGVPARKLRDLPPA